LIQARPWFSANATGWGCGGPAAADSAAFLARLRRLAVFIETVLATGRDGDPVGVAESSVEVREKTEIAG
jgi:hypothetical protein